MRNGRGISRERDATYSPLYEQKGGSVVLIGGTTPVFERVTFSNSTLKGIGFGIQGGIFYIENSSPTFKSCAFIGSSAGQGGAGWIQGGSPIFIDCLFEECETNSKNRMGGGGGWLGGAIVPESDSNSLFQRCTFRKNKAPYGGAVDDGSEAKTVYEACLFEENTANYGGAYYAFSKHKAYFTIRISYIM